MTLITRQRQLQELCDSLRDAPFLAVDTEFMRERTYWPKLCLVQVAHGDIAAAVDPLADGIDLAPLFDLLDNSEQTKVLHSATQDLELFYGLTGRVPHPVFDTQVAAAFCGLGEQPGYANVVGKLLGHSVDKASQSTDWSRRPLSKRQLAYALADVTHLCEIYEHMWRLLTQAGRLEWVLEEMPALTREENYAVVPRECWRRLKVRRPTTRTLGILRELAAWREETAMARDLPRGWVVRDEALVEIATHQLTDPDELERVRGLSAKVAHGADGRKMIAAVKRGLALAEDELPELPQRRDKDPGGEDRVALLRALLKQRAEEHGLADTAVATRDELDALGAGRKKDLRTLTGWRRSVFGDDALRLLAGELALRIVDDRVVVVPVAADA